MDLRKIRMLARINVDPDDDQIIEKLLKLCEAGWWFQEKPGEPHAILTSGLHSDGYFSLNTILQFPKLCDTLGKALVIRLKKSAVDTEQIDAVVSSTFAAQSLGQSVAKHCNAAAFFTEKIAGEQKWTGRFNLLPGMNILQIEELITTLKTTRSVRDAILGQNINVNFAKNRRGKIIVGTIIHRPAELVEHPDYRVIALKEMQINSWEAKDCPLCKKGSEALKPKPNWAKFMEFT